MKSQGGIGTPILENRSPKNQKKRGRSPLTPRTQQKLNEASKFIEMQNAIETLGITCKKTRRLSTHRLSPIKGGKTRRKKSSSKRSDV